MVGTERGRKSNTICTTKYGKADGLSRFPLAALAETDEDYAKCFYFEQFQTVPVTVFLSTECIYSLKL